MGFALEPHEEKRLEKVEESSIEFAKLKSQISLIVGIVILTFGSLIAAAFRVGDEAKIIKDKINEVNLKVEKHLVIHEHEANDKNGSR